MVMSTAADKDDLTSLVLTSGRKYTALLPDPVYEGALEAALNEAAVDAVARGFHAHHGGGAKRVEVGGLTLPASVPVDNIPAAIREKIERSMESADDDANTGAAAAMRALSLAKESAEEYGLEIKVKTCLLCICGTRFRSDETRMFLQSSLHSCGMPLILSRHFIRSINFDFVEATSDLT